MHALFAGGALPSLVAAFFDSIDEPVLLCDGSWNVVAANPAAAGLLEAPAGALAGANALELAPQPPGSDPPSRDHGPVEWRSETRGTRTPVAVAVSALPLADERTGERGWALRLKPVDREVEAPELAGRSALVQELRAFVSRVAASGASSILLVGESGTGKELVARRLHALSRRAAKPFIAINCPALPENLLESELFGFEEGAFTGARHSKEGLIEVADGGTLLLDEIGELPVGLQVKLLRVLEGHSFRRLGGAREIKVDVRVVGATNADLQKAIAEGRFRSDLYHRLNGVQIRLPALRERPEDVGDLAAYFLSYFNRVHGRNILGIHPSALRLMEIYQWPGNVRELRNVVERSVLVATPPLIMPGDLALAGGRGSAKAAFAAAANSTHRSARYSLRSSERELIATALAECGGNQSRAAELLGIGRFALRYKMKKLGML